MKVNRLKRIIAEELRKLKTKNSIREQKRLLTEADEEWWCNCGCNCGSTEYINNRSAWSLLSASSII